MPIIVDEVVISVEVANQAAGGAGAGGGAVADRRTSRRWSAECVERVLDDSARAGGALRWPTGGTLEQLTIQAYEAADYSGSPVATFEAYVNPNEITLGYEIEYDAAQGAGHHRQPHELQEDEAGRPVADLLPRRHRRQRPRVDVQQRGRAVPDRHRLQRQDPPAQLPEGGVGHAAGQALRAEERRRSPTSCSSPTACRCAPSSPPTFSRQLRRPDARRAGAGRVARPDARAR